MTTTETHPFYVPAKGWTEAAKLRAGDILVTVNGEYAVLEQVSHEITESPVRVYNFEVEGLHTYYVGADESDPGSFVLVHNSCRGEAVKKAWKNEYINVKNGGNGITRIWSAAEKVELLERGKVSGYVGHHIKCVQMFPEFAGDPTNIQFLTIAQHFAAHRGNLRNITEFFYVP